MRVSYAYLGICLAYFLASPSFAALKLTPDDKKPFLVIRQTPSEARLMPEART